MNQRITFLSALLVCLLCFSLSLNGQEKASFVSESGKEQQEEEKLDLSFLTPGITYSFSQGENEELQIFPVSFCETDLTPLYYVFNPMDENTPPVTKRESPPDEILFKGGQNFKSTSASQYYSGMFSSASPEWYWAFNYYYTSFTNLLNEKGAAGFRIESIDIYPDLSNTNSLYAATWTRDGLGWAWALNYSTSQFVTLLNSHGTAGRRVTDIEFDRRSRLFGGVWSVDGKGWYWAFNYDFTAFSQILQTQQSEGRRPIDLQVYLNDAGTGWLYAGVWINNSEGYSWSWALNQTWDQFQTLLTQNGAANRRIIDYEVYHTSQGNRYCGAWVNDGNAWAYSLNFSDRTEFINQINSWYNNNNLRPVSFEMYTDLSSSVEEFVTAEKHYELVHN